MWFLEDYQILKNIDVEFVITIAIELDFLIFAPCLRSREIIVDSLLPYLCIISLPLILKHKHK